MSKPNFDLDSIVDDTLKEKQKHRNALALLLDEVLDSEGSIIAERVNMAGIESFISSVSLSWVAANVGLAKQLPLFKKFLDEDTGKLKVDAESLDLFTQREVDFSRQHALAQYLITNSVHKFPPLLVVMTAPWVDDPHSDAWDSSGKAIRGVADFDALDNKRMLGLLRIDGESLIYALDGQHRKIGIDGAVELVREGRLEVRKASGDAVNGRTILLDDLIERNSLDESQVQQIPNERIGIEVIPAVVMGETRNEARQRVRAVFTHVNKQAKSLTGGELAQLDEDDGFAIVARNVAVNNNLFETPKGQVELVNFKNATVSAKAEYFTTLQTLKEMTQRFLASSDHFSTWQSKGSMLPTRPTPDDLDLANEAFSEFLGYFATLPSIQRMKGGEKTSIMRRFPDEDPPGEGHMLFRPIGQIVLAQACGYANVHGRSLEEIFELLHKFDEDGKFTLQEPENLWWGILYAKGKMRVSGRDTASRLLVHLLIGTADHDARDGLALEIREARDIAGDGTQYMGFDGLPHKNPLDIALPPML